MDHYTTLGVNKTATQDDIKNAYRKLARVHHPDSGGDPEHFKRINLAYSILGDQRSRSEYDYTPNEDTSSYKYRTDAHNMQDFFNDIFGASAGFHHSQYTQPKNKDLRATLKINLNTITQPQRRTVHLKTGRSEKTIEVDIPAGVNDGATIRYRGYGQDILTKVPPGDLVVTIRVCNVAGFTRDKKNIHSEISINAVDAMLGTKVEFINLDGSKVLVSIPAGVQPDQQLRLTGKGLPDDIRHNGDLILTVKITVPTNLTEQQENLLKQFKSG